MLIPHTPFQDLSIHPREWKVSKNNLSEYGHHSPPSLPCRFTVLPSCSAAKERFFSSHLNNWIYPIFQLLNSALVNEIASQLSLPNGGQFSPFVWFRIGLLKKPGSQMDLDNMQASISAD
jgi:hypothetical protein